MNPSLLDSVEFKYAMRVANDLNTFDDHFASFELPNDQLDDMLELKIERHTMIGLRKYGFDMSLVEEQVRIKVGESNKIPDIVAYYPDSPRTQDHIALIIECKRPRVNIIDSDHYGWSYLKSCLRACRYAKFGMLTNGNECRFLLKYPDEIMETTSDCFWPDIQLICGVAACLEVE